MRAVALVLLAAISAAAQLPDDPATAKRKRDIWKPEIRSEKRIPWKHVFTDKRFLVPHLVAFASGVLDVEVTHAGLAHHRCVEAGANPRPSRAELYTNTMIPLAAFTAFDAVMRKANMPFYMYNGGAAYGSFVHFRGAGKWLKNCW